MLIIHLFLRSTVFVWILHHFTLFFLFFYFCELEKQMLYIIMFMLSVLFCAHCKLLILIQNLIRSCCFFFLSSLLRLDVMSRNDHRQDAASSTFRQGRQLIIALPATIIKQTLSSQITALSDPLKCMCLWPYVEISTSSWEKRVWWYNCCLHSSSPLFGNVVTVWHTHTHTLAS